VFVQPAQKAEPVESIVVGDQVFRTDKVYVWIGKC
jgi:hypothetical protein